MLDDPSRSINSGDKISLDSILSKQYHVIVPTALILYVLLQYAFAQLKNAETGTHLYCHEKIEVPSWLRGLSLGAAFCLLSNTLLQLFFASKYLFEGKSESTPLIAMHLSVATVHTIAGSSQLITYTGLFDHICLDGFG